MKNTKLIKQKLMGAGLIALGILGMILGIEDGMIIPIAAGMILAIQNRVVIY